MKSRAWKKEIAQRFGLLAQAPGALIPKPKAKGTSRPKKATEPEASIQGRAEALCASLGLRFLRFPDAAYKALFASEGVPTFLKVLVARYLKGAPDMTILKPCGRYNLALCLEIKTEQGDTSKAQEQWARDVNVTVAHGWQETETAIREFYDTTHSNQGKEGDSNGNQEGRQVHQGRQERLLRPTRGPGVTGQSP